MSTATPSHASSKPDKKTTRVPVSQKAAWGVGGFAENFANNAILQMVYPVFNIGYGLSPFMIGIALSISRVLDAFSDPPMGNWSDNSRTRWGRRRPFIFVGALIMTAFFAIMWFPPDGASKAVLFTYLSISACIFYLGFTIFIIPFSALGLELSDDYQERATLSVYRNIPGQMANFILPWILALLMLDTFGGEVHLGARWIGPIAALLILLTSLPAALVCRERFAKHHQEPIRLKDALKYTFTNRAYLRVVGAAFLVFIGLYAAIPLMQYINIFYIFSGDMKQAGILGGTVGTIIAFSQIGILPVISWLTRYFDKHKLLAFGLFTAAAGYGSTWFCFSPEMPYLQIVSLMAGNLGLCFAWLLNHPLVADICDDDEVRTGRRREGMFSAVFGFIYKGAIGIMAIGGGLLLAWAGVDGSVPEVLPSESIFRIRLIYLCVPTLCFLAAGLLVLTYPLTRVRMTEIKVQLQAKRELQSRTIVR